MHVLNCRQSNLYSPEANAAFEQAEYFVKTQPTTARQVPKGQSELVVVRSGATRDTANALDWIVQSFSGEEYVVHKEDFDQLYTPMDGGRFMPVRDPRKLVRVREDIVFASPWGNGELQTVRKGGYIIERIIRSGPHAGQRERYGIAQKDAEPDFKPTQAEPHERF